MKSLRAFCVDHEIHAARRIKLLLQAMPFVELVGQASSCAEALVGIARTNPDVILLDVQLKEGDGFELIDALNARPNPPFVVLVTAFDHFAVRAFDYSVVDYLLKPVDRGRLAAALGRARTLAQNREAELRLLEMQEVVRSLRNAASPKTQSDYDSEFWIRGAEGFIRVPIESVECVGSEDDYIALHTATGAHLMRSSLRRFERRIEPGHFVRVHRRWLVRKTAISELRSLGSGIAQVKLRSGRIAPVGRVYLKQLRDRLLTPRP